MPYEFSTEGVYVIACEVKKFADHSKFKIDSSRFGYYAESLLMWLKVCRIIDQE